MPGILGMGQNQKTNLRLLVDCITKLLRLNQIFLDLIHPAAQAKLLASHAFQQVLHPLFAANSACFGDWNISLGAHVFKAVAEITVYRRHRPQKLMALFEEKLLQSHSIAPWKTGS